LIQIGWTSGGSPIFSGPKGNKGQRKQGKTLYKCKCGARNTKNQIIGNEGKCVQCKTQLAEKMLVWVKDGNYVGIVK